MVFENNQVWVFFLNSKPFVRSGVWSACRGQPLQPSPLLPCPTASSIAKEPLSSDSQLECLEILSRVLQSATVLGLLGVQM